MLKNMLEFILSLNFVLIYTNLSEKHVLLPKKYKIISIFLQNQEIAIIPLANGWETSVQGVSLLINYDKAKTKTHILAFKNVISLVIRGFSLFWIHVQS